MEEDKNPKPLDQAELEKLPRKTLAKSMRNAEDILVDLAAGVELDEDEERLADLLVFQAHGKHIGRFKNQKPEEEPEPVLNARGDFGDTEKTRDSKKPKLRKNEMVVEPKGTSDVVLKAEDVVS